MYSYYVNIYFIVNDIASLKHLPTKQESSQ